MQSGKMNQLVTIEQLTQPQNDSGDTIDTWTPVTGFVRIPASVLPDRAQEFFAAKQIQATRNALIVIYFKPGITEKMRAVHHVRPGMDDYYDVAGVVPFQSNQHELRLYGIWREAEGYRRGVDIENA